MDPEFLLKLRKCREDMISNLEFDLMSPCLIQFSIISTSEYDDIKSKSGNSEKVIHENLILDPY